MRFWNLMLLVTFFISLVACKAEYTPPLSTSQIERIEALIVENHPCSGYGDLLEVFWVDKTVEKADTTIFFLTAKCNLSDLPDRDGEIEHNFRAVLCDTMLLAVYKQFTFKGLLAETALFELPVDPRTEEWWKGPEDYQHFDTIIANSRIAYYDSIAGHWKEGLYGNVQIAFEKTTVFCDTAIFNPARRTLEIDGSVKVIFLVGETESVMWGEGMSLELDSTSRGNYTINHVHSESINQNPKEGL